MHKPTYDATDQTYVKATNIIFVLKSNSRLQKINILFINSTKI